MVRKATESIRSRQQAGIKAASRKAQPAAAPRQRIKGLPLSGVRVPVAGIVTGLYGDAFKLCIVRDKIFVPQAVADLRERRIGRFTIPILWVDELFLEARKGGIKGLFRDYDEITGQAGEHEPFTFEEELEYLDRGYGAKRRRQRNYDFFYGTEADEEEDNYAELDSFGQER